jgi:hypothetical protein
METAVLESRKSRGRSRVTNGNELFVEPTDRRTAISRRFRDILSAIVADLGGADRLSEGQRQLARRVALMSMQCENMEARSVGGAEIDLDMYGQLSDRIGRACQRLGLKRVPREIVPDLRTYIAEGG